MSFVSGLILAAGATAAPAAADAPQPIRIVADRVGDAMRITLLGDAAQRFEGEYALDVSCATRGGTNFSSQSGHARLEPGAPTTLVTLVLADAALGSWRATLKVTPKGGQGYTMVSGS